jgi:DNA glycosylase AlkZ-like
MPLSDIARHRLHNQHITSAPFAKPGDVVSWLVAVQAQDYAGAKWALGLRLQQGARDADIDRVFNAGAILRTHVLRPTWHFVTPADIRWLLALTAPRVHAVNAHRYRQLELDDAALKRSRKVLMKALQGGKLLTRDELRDALQAAKIATDGQRLAYMLMHAELGGIICSGPRRGKQFTYALLEERVPPAPTPQRAEALAEFARRYFTSHGPATVQDFAKWSGLTSADAKRGLEAVKDQLQHEVLNSNEYWSSPTLSPVKAVSPTAYLLSVYDEYITGYKDRSMIGKPEVAAKLFTMGNALTAVVVVDGQIVGTWRRTLNKETVVVEISSFTQLTKAEQRSVVAAAQRYSEFLEKPVALA